MKRFARLSAAIERKLNPKKKEQTLEYLNRELKDEITTLLCEMRTVQQQFENETDFDLIEADIWALRALEVRYQRALRLVKQSF